MTLDEKRAVIEALLCAAGDANNVSLMTAIEFVSVNANLVIMAIDPSYVIYPVGALYLSDRYAVIAYRLIESSPTLRREWFGQ